jgi:hypothetical protein
MIPKVYIKVSVDKETESQKREKIIKQIILVFAWSVTLFLLIWISSLFGFSAELLKLLAFFAGIFLAIEFNNKVMK